MQLELEPANFAHDSEPGTAGTVKTNGYGISPFGLRWGMRDGWDLEAAFDGFSSVTETAENGAKSTVQGLGDAYLRTKVALAETPDYAAALIAFGKVPTAAKAIGNGRVEGGLALPVAVGLTDDVSFGAMRQAEAVYEETDDTYRARLAGSVTLSRSLTPRLSVYGEYFAARMTGPDAHWENTASIGAAYILTDDVQIDGGVDFGASARADDINLFVGISYRW